MKYIQNIFFSNHKLLLIVIYIINFIFYFTIYNILIYHSLFKFLQDMKY